MEPNYSAPPHNPDELRIKRLKRSVFAAIAVVVLIILALIVLYVVHYLSLGQIVVTTNSSGNTITLTRSYVREGGGGDSKDRQPSVKLKSGQQASVEPGTYFATVLGANSAGASRIVTVVARHTSSYTINTSAPTSTEPVADVNALSLAASQSQLFYLDRQTNNLYKIDSQNQLLSVSNQVKFNNIQWLNSSFGLGQSQDNKFYTISNGVVSQIQNLPASLGDSVIFAVGPNQSIYLANGKDIYEGSASTGFNQIFTAKNPPVLLSPSSTGLLALIYNPGDGPSSGGSKENITILSGSRVVAQEEIEAYDAKWSPDGKYLITTTDSNSQILTANLNPVVVVPNNNINNPVWLDNNTVLFSVYNQLWEYSLTSASAKVVASAPKGHAITSIQLGDNGDYAYLSVQSTPGSNNDLMIERFGLKGQAGPAFINTLQQKLPILQEGRCLLSLTNFSSPTIQIFGGQPEDNCPAAAANYVQQFGIDPSRLTYLSTNVPPDEPIN